MKAKIVGIIQLIMLLIYVLTTNVIPSMASDVLHESIILFAVLVILISGRKIKTFKFNWLMFTAMGAFWIATDVLWLIYKYLLYIDPNDSTFLLYLYVLPNIFMLINVSVYFFKNIKKWYRLHLFLDMTILFVIIMILFGTLAIPLVDFSHMSLVNLISLILYIVIDLIVLLIILTVMASSRLKFITRTFYLISFGCLVYLVADLVYVYMYSMYTYYPNSISDLIFAGAFTLFALASINEVYQPTPYCDLRKKSDVENYGNSYFVWMVAIIPLVLFAYRMIDLLSIFWIFIAIIIYQILNHEVLKALTSEKLLVREQEVIESMENLIQERTVALIRTNEELAVQTKTDFLTGLYNRSYFLRLIDDAIKNKHGEFSVIFMDLDRFKVINDSYGHAIGDEVLKVIAQRFSKKNCDLCKIARIGGDEFGILYRSTSLLTLEKISYAIIELLGECIQVGNFQFFVTASLGIARYPEDASDREQLLKYADIAMYHAKRSDHAFKYVVYASELTKRIERRNYIELQLRTADFEKDFTLYFQPQFDTKSRTIIGMEALIRWFHKDEGFISPSEFITIAEETGIIIRLSQWIFKRAMLQIKQWNENYHSVLKMGINVSPIMLDSVDFFPNLYNLMEMLEINPSWLDFEITEHSAMNTSIVMEEIFAALNKVGANVSIDDFGTGYSSLSYIKRFDVDRLKIAKELIDNITTDEDESLIVKAIIMMAEGMGLKTIAEGVETEEQLSILKTLNCDAIQGYILGRPVPADEFERLYLAK